MDQQQDSTKPAWLTASDPLATYWTKDVGELAAQPKKPWLHADVHDMHERYRLYSLLVLALLHEYRNGNKYGPEGAYHDRRTQIYHQPEGGTDAVYGPLKSYLGHNIACIAVDGAGEVIDYEFNHNDVYGSSMEHAESRLVRRVFSLTQIYDDWYTTSAPKANVRRIDFNTTMNLVTIFTSLESCAQCAGIMALAGVREVVYLQADPGMSCVGNMLYNLTRDAEGKLIGGRIASPYPLSARSFAFEHTEALEGGYQTFREAISPDRPFVTRQGESVSSSASITSFLCTDAAMDIFERGRYELDSKLTALDEITKAQTRKAGDSNDPASLQEAINACLHDSKILSDANFAPAIYNRNDEEVSPDAGRKALTNREVLENIQAFLTYARSSGHRGTAHKV